MISQKYLILLWNSLLQEVIEEMDFSRVLDICQGTTIFQLLQLEQPPARLRKAVLASGCQGSI